MQSDSTSEAAHLPLAELVAGVAEEDYNRDPGLRSTELKHAARSAAHWQSYLAEPRRDSEEMAFGRLAHLAILEPERFRAVAHCQPDFGKGEGSRKSAAAWRADLPPGAVVYSEQDREVLRAIYRRVHEHTRAKNMLRGARREVALAWEDGHYGLRCKARYDILSAEGFAVDIKTTRDASHDAFGRDLVARGYTFSAAHYLEGLRQTELGHADRFFFIACEKTPPYAVAVYSLSPMALKRGRWWQRHALATIKEARDTGVFAAYGEAVQTLEEPGYAPLPPGYTRSQLHED